MDTKEYIASGILTNYVLGTVSEQERREVECLSKIYPEILQELKAEQRAMENYVHSIAVDPPAELRSKIISAVKETDQEAMMKVVDKDQEGGPAQNSAYRWLAAASIALMVLAGGTIFYQSSRNAELSNQLASTSSEKEKLQGQLEKLESSVEELSEREQLIAERSTKEWIMEGTESKPDAKAKIYWNTEKQKVVLASTGLPTPIEGKQYQLWAIADGSPVSLGVLDKEKLVSEPIKMNLSNVQAFAITLEKEGGSPVPTMEEMYVIVSVI